MPRRSWRDLDRPGSGNAATAPFGPFRSGQDDLERAAAMSADQRLTALVAQRRELETRLRGLTGQSGANANDPAIAARFPVASFADRRREQREWEARRQAMTRQQDEIRRASFAPATTGPDASAAMPQVADRFAPPATGMARQARSALGQRLAAARTAIGQPRRQVGEGLTRLRSVTAPSERAARPLRQAADKIDNARDQLRDLDAKLAEQGASEADRAAIRKAMKGETLDKVGGALGRAQKALDAPKRAADRIGAEWQRRESQITAPMDRASSYADRRDRRLSPETGGSGDLFERMIDNRRRAQERRRAQQLQEQRDQDRRDRARARRRESEAEERRDDA